jgi:hypothetical protein
MFFTGAMLIYSGFNNTTPLQMIRSFLQAGGPNPNVTPYDPSFDPFFYGVDTGGNRTYQAPARMGNPGLYS